MQIQFKYRTPQTPLLGGFLETADYRRCFERAGVEVRRKNLFCVRRIFRARQN